MDDARLSAREQRALAEIEEQLDRDEPLARNLRTMRRGPRLRLPPLSGGHRFPTLGLAALGALTLALLVLAVATEAPLLIWLFAATWVVTLIVLLTRVVRWSRRWAERSRRTE
ncbi:DUF3040 domain-containing protein [Streptomyces sp. NPDC093089]|uniref:DUF3040 domain-containing protein n=1 Tax=Streptomyces sp. NPDC093089 TaxID=3366024 RepID=UPI0038117835